MTNRVTAEQIFHAARQKSDPAERAGFLEGACGNDVSLRAEVQALLNADAETGTFLTESTRARRHEVTAGSDPDATIPRAGRGLSSPVPGAPSEQAGQMIGRYKLLQPIGEGGFGSVWMAQQEQPVRRRVALKIIKLGMDTRQVIARFEAERQALAMMDHPNIAKVLDAGSTETGRPYFVMEYIKGVPILEYCDTDKLDTGARLELFTSVCHAIQHAHQKGIIHRDIKPSNVLVTMHDGVPVPKVIDFGIAKATSSELTAKTLFTEHRQIIGTPAYMSPEQAEMSGLDIDTRSDIYSLGVLLYELLTGTTPFDGKELTSKGFAEMMRIIREVEPHKPSSRLGSLGETGTRTAQQRRAVDPKKLSHTLKGDLDWIVMKCLEKDRTRRYETASGLAADIKRHLHDEPVTAGAPSTGYRLRKFVKRNRAQVIAGGIVATALVLGVIGTTGGMIWAYREKKRAEVEKTRATLAAESEARAKVAAQENAEKAIAEARRAQAATEEEAAARKRAETVAEFMSDTLNGAGPSVARGRDITMLREMMDAASARIEKGDLKSAPEAELRLRNTIGNTYRELAVYDAAQKMLEPAVALARSTHAKDDAATANVLINLALLFQARGDLARAEPLYRESLEIYKHLFSGDSAEVASSLFYMAQMLQARGDLAGAESLNRQSLKMYKHLFPGDSSEVAATLNFMAQMLQARGDLAGAEPLYRESLEMYKHLFPGDHPYVATAFSTMAYLLQARGDLAGAEPLYRESLKMKRHLFPGDHPDVASTLNNLATLLQIRGDLAAAEPLFRESLEMHRHLFPGDHPLVATSLNNLANLLVARGDLTTAEPLSRQSLEMRRRLFPGDHADVGAGMGNLAWARQRLGKTAEARQGFYDSLAMLRRLSPGGSALMARVLWRSGSARLENKDVAAALPELEEAVAMAGKFLPPAHPQLKEYRETLAECKSAAAKQAKSAGEGVGK